MDAFFSVGGGAGGIDGMTADVGAVDVGAGGFGTGFGGGEAKTILTSVFVEGFGLLHGALGRRGVWEAAIECGQEGWLE